MQASSLSVCPKHDHHIGPQVTTMNPNALLSGSRKKYLAPLSNETARVPFLL